MVGKTAAQSLTIFHLSLRLRPFHLPQGLAGGTVLNLVGENFDDGALVFIGSRPCLNTVVVNERSVSCVTPGSTSEVTESVEVYVQSERIGFWNRDLYLPRAGAGCAGACDNRDIT